MIIADNINIGFLIVLNMLSFQPVHLFNAIEIS